MVRKLTETSFPVGSLALDVHFVLLHCRPQAQSGLPWRRGVLKLPAGTHGWLAFSVSNRGKNHW